MACCGLDLPWTWPSLTMSKLVARDVLSAVSNRNSSSRSSRKRRRSSKLILPIAVLTAVTAAGAGWLGVKARTISTELNAAAELLPNLKQEISASDTEAAELTVAQFRQHTRAARQEAGDPVWTLASGLPWIGPNMSAVSEVARSADDVANLALTPLMSVYSSLDWNTVMPHTSGADFQPLQAAAPKVASAAYAVRASLERLEAIDPGQLFSQVSEPLHLATMQLKEATGALDSAADVASIAPDMLGANGPRHYLLTIQNNAEARASGGIPGALAVVTFDAGRLSLGAQSSAGEIGTMAPTLAVDPEQEQIYSSRLGKFMQDVNLTPDFPTAAGTVQAMWERKTGQRVDGVLSIDPIALSYILDATGPMQITGSDVGSSEAFGLPSELNSENVVQTLLSDVYAKIEEPKLQDAYFAVVAQQIFAAFAKGEGDAKGLLDAITQAAQEGRALIWSSRGSEQSIIAKHPLSGSVTGPSVAPAQFGVYFNDGTGAKMDYYVKRTVQLVKECPRDGYEETTVRVTATNTAPLDAATTLPEYVTGGGVYGVPPGSVQTNIAVYGPVQANVETVKLGGTKTEFAPHIHSNRPVGVVAVRLAPGESKSLDFTFSKIVQHTEPNVVVTPTVQNVKDVTLRTLTADCNENN